MEVNKKVDFAFRKERKMGEIVQDFINLLRIVLGHFFRTLFRMAIVPLCGMLVLIYYGTTRINLKVGAYGWGSAEQILFVLAGLAILLAVSMVFFGLAIEYFVLLKQRKATDFGSADVWQAFLRHFGRYVLFFLVSVVAGLIIGVPLLLAMAVLAFIPLVGSIAVGVLASFVGVWFFCAFLFYREGYFGAAGSLSKTFGILSNRFIDYGLSSYLVSFIFQILVFMLALMPSIVLAIIAYNTIGFDDTFFDTFFGRMLVAIGGSIVVALTIGYYMCSVLVYGIIYETAKERKYGEDIYEKINHLGKEEDEK